MYHKSDLYEIKSKLLPLEEFHLINLKKKIEFKKLMLSQDLEYKYFLLDIIEKNCDDDIKNDIIDLDAPEKYKIDKKKVITDDEINFFIILINKIGRNNFCKHIVDDKEYIIFKSIEPKFTIQFKSSYFLIKSAPL